jgi:DNA-binding SARP family transcriptional activator
MEEREQLHGLALVVLRGYAEILHEAGDLETATATAARLAEAEPLDPDVQQFFLGLILEGRRWGEASRRYELYRARMRRAFSVEPDFDLSDLCDRDGRG